LFAFTAVQAQMNPVPHRNAAPVAVSNSAGEETGIVIKVNKPLDWDNVYIEVYNSGTNQYSDYLCNQLQGDIYTYTIPDNTAFDNIFFLNSFGDDMIYGAVAVQNITEEMCFRLGNEVTTTTDGGYTYKTVSCEMIDCVQPISIHLTSLDSYSFTPYIFAWDASHMEEGEETGESVDLGKLSQWPGIPMTSIGNNQYTYTFDESVSKVNIIFNKGDNSGYQTVDIENVTSSTCYKFDGTSPYNSVADRHYFGYVVTDCSETKYQTTTIRFNPYTVDWDIAYLYVWTGSNYYNDYGAKKLVAAQQMTLADDGWWTYSFENVPGTSFYVGFGYQQDSYPDYYNSSTTYSGSTCFEMNSDNYHIYLQQVDYRKLETETVTIRFNPYTVTWDNAWLSVASQKTLVATQQMTMADDGWWTYSFEILKGADFSVRFDSQQDQGGERCSTSSTTSTSNCFEINKGSLQQVNYRKLSLDENNSFTIHVATAGTFGQMMVQKLGDRTWTDILSLTVTGSLNDEDMKYFARMTSMRQLDLSGAEIINITGCGNLTSLLSVVLPSSCVMISDGAFKGCTMLSSINLNKIQSIGNSAFSGCTRFTSLTLENVQSIGNSAFYQCNRITSLSLPKVQTIGQLAFATNSSESYSSFVYSSALTSVTMPVVTTIGRQAFYQNRNLASVSMPLVTEIGELAFANCHALAKVDIANVTNLGTAAFAMYDDRYNRDDDSGSYNAQLTEVSLSDELDRIPDYCFRGCDKLTSLSLPKALKSIGESALPFIASVELPDGVTSVGSGNFTNATSITIPASVTSWSAYSSSWKDVYCYLVAPPAFSVFNTETMNASTLHVPAISLAAYKLHDNWYHFGKIVPMEGDIDNLVISSNFTLLTTDGIADKADLTLNPYGALNLSAENALTIGNYVQQINTKKNYSSKYSYDENGNYQYYYYSYMPYTGMLLANSAITADNVTVRLVPWTNRWNFFSLPFDVNMTDITIGTEGSGTVGTSQWVIREYSGANRASGNGTTWNNVPADGVLKANTGYILYWVLENSGSTNESFYYYFNMPAVKNANMQNIFATGDVIVPLTEYSAEFPQNRSWNLVGNPYPCAFNIQQMDFNAPITTWNGSGYTAYSVEDDSYMLRPAEAFFVQAPQGTTGLTFRKEGRSVVNTVEVTYEEYQNNYYYNYNAPARRVAAHNPARKVFNFTLSNADYTDRARLVLNGQASADYELTRDAAKMLSQDKTVPQLWLTDNGVRYAIDERPEQSMYVLGAFFGKTGEYTLHLNMPQNEDRRIQITDTETGAATELTNGDYTFTTDAGTFDSRFVISFAPRVATGIDDTQSLTAPAKTIENGSLIITTPQGKKYTAGGIEL